MFKELVTTQKEELQTTLEKRKQLQIAQAVKFKFWLNMYTYI